MSVYCNICLSRCEPDEFSGICECPNCEEIFDAEDGLSAEEAYNTGCPGSDEDDQ